MLERGSPHPGQVCPGVVQHSLCLEMALFGEFQFSIQMTNCLFQCGCQLLNKISPSLCQLRFNNKTLSSSCLPSFERTVPHLVRTLQVLAHQSGLLIHLSARALGHAKLVTSTAIIPPPPLLLSYLN